MAELEVVIIGGGVIGLSTAYALASSGLDGIALIERSTQPSGSTARAAGVVTHQMWNPFNQALAKRSVEIYHEIERASHGRFAFQKVGGLITTSRVGDAVRQEGVAHSLRRLSVKVQLLKSDEVRSMIPGIKSRDVRVATYCPEDGYINPFEFLSVTSALVGKSGRVGFVYQSAANIRRADSGYAIETDSQTINCRKLVLAAGAWSRTFLEKLGVDLHLGIRRAQVAVASAHHSWGRLPTYYDRSQDMYVAPLGSANVLIGADGRLDGSLDGPDDCDLELDSSYSKIVLSRFRRRFADMVELKGGWAGLYTDSPDGLPLMGEVSGYPGLYVGTGDLGLGLVMGPAMGESLANLVAGRTTGMNVEPFDPNRFSMRSSRLGLLAKANR